MMGTVVGFYEYNTIPELILNGRAKLYNEILVGDKIPTCIVFVMIDGKISSYYPLWVYPDFTQIRNKKLEKIGI